MPRSQGLDSSTVAAQAHALPNAATSIGCWSNAGEASLGLRETGLGPGPDGILPWHAQHVGSVTELDHLLVSAPIGPSGLTGAGTSTAVRAMIAPMAHSGDRWRFARGVTTRVEIDDQSRFGSPLTGRPDERTRELFQPFMDHIAQHGLDDLPAVSSHLLAESIASDAFRAISEPDDTGAWRLHDDVIQVEIDKVRFTALLVGGTGNNMLRVEVTSEAWGSIHQLIARLAGPGQTDDDPSLTPDATRLLDALARDGMVLRAPPVEVPSALRGPGVTFLGHNLVLVRSETARVVVDPYFVPASERFGGGYRPVLPNEYGPLDGVVITHSHPDHFSPESLLQIPPDVPIVVPKVPRETLLSVALAERARQLGFTRVIELAWGEHVRLSGIEIHALPFFGEQPTDSRSLHPDVRNEGNTYLIRTDEFSVACLADSGRDHRGDVRDVAEDAHASFGPVDVLFCGYRGWRTYPAQFLRSSVARYALFVPPSAWGSRQKIMADVDHAIDVAERWHARMLVPYADGGAPWFWEHDLGPRLDDLAHEVPSIDPFPDRVVDAARRRVSLPTGGWLASPVPVTLLRPNDSLVDFARPDGPRMVRMPGNSWPYDSDPEQQ